MYSNVILNYGAWVTVLSFFSTSAALYLPTGQFQHTDMSIKVVKDHVAGGAHQSNKERVLARGILRWGSEHMLVTLQDKTMKDTVRKRHLSKCWVVPKAAIERLLGHPYESYVVDHV